MGTTRGTGRVRTNRIPNGELKQSSPTRLNARPARPNEQNSEWGIETTPARLAPARLAPRPNEQNSEWGIETAQMTFLDQEILGVRTNRIPNGELKLEWPCGSSPVPCPVRTNRIPNGELKLSCRSRSTHSAAGPNEQNSEWGIETPVVRPAR